MNIAEDLKELPKTRAGIIPFYLNENNEFVMLFMRPSDPKFGGNEFQIAKGIVEDGYGSNETALKEGEEELGLDISNIKKLYKVGKFGTMTVLACSLLDEKKFNEPHYETGETKWLTKDEFDKIGRKWQKFIVDITVKRLTKLIGEKK